MGYKKAAKVLPVELLKVIQEYVDGEYLYIPRKEEMRKDWGSNTNIRIELKERNKEIYTDYESGDSINELSKKYYLSVKSIQRIIREEKNYD